VVARDIALRIGLAAPDVEAVATAVQFHLLLPQTATRRDLGDPATVRRVAEAVRGRGLLDLLHALAVADGLATGPAAWSDWKAGLVAELVRRVSAELAGEPPPQPASPRPGQLALVAGGEESRVLVGDGEVTVVAPDRPGLLWRAAGVLASHRLLVRSANVSTHDGTALAVLQVAPEYGDPPDPALVAGDLRRMLAGRLDVADRLRRRARAHAPAPRTPAPPPKVTLVDDASAAATVVEIRAHDEPGLLWRLGHALGECGLDVRAARVETLGAEVVDAFYVVDGDGQPVRDLRLRGQIAARVLEALTG
jgi:[protein-PII] uridylyltransferase